MEDTKRAFFKYSEEDLKSAITEVIEKDGKIRETARKYRIPHSTLLNKLKRRTPEVRKMGPSTILTPAEEQLLCNWLNANAKRGIPINKRTLLETVKELMTADDRCNPFSKNKPGKKWFTAFLKRHPQIAQRHAESINLSRTLINESSIRKWHKDLHNYLKDENALDIISEPWRIFNADISGFLTNPQSGLVLAPKGMDNLYAIKSGSEKESITVLVTINADGEIFPPMIVYPYERIPSAIVKNLNPNWHVGRSTTGWMTSQTFYGYIANAFLPRLKDSGTKLPVLFLIDGHKSHLTYTTSKFCAENGIILYSLLPNATHILQPADVSVFRPLDLTWKIIVEDWKKKTGNRNVTRILFGPLFESCLNIVSKDTVKNGFKKCGIFPFDVEAIDYTKCLRTESRMYKGDEKDQVKPTTFNVEHLLFLESLMPSGRAEEFRAAESAGWKGPDSAKELYDVWLKLRKRLVTNTKNLPDEAGNSTNGVKPSQYQTFDDTVSNTQNFPEEAENSRDAVEAFKHYQSLEDIEKNEVNIEPEVQGETSSNVKVEEISSIQKGNSDTMPVNIPKIESSVSPAFLNHVIWPSESPKKSSKRKRERLPLASTSNEWLSYWKDKEQKQKNEELKKKKRQEVRKAKKLKKTTESNTQKPHIVKLCV